MCNDSKSATIPLFCNKPMTDCVKLDRLNALKRQKGDFMIDAYLLGFHGKTTTPIQTFCIN